jgi:formylglycine-generating enzyme required for sulfatase activity
MINKIYLILLALIASHNIVNANNITVTNVLLQGQNTSNNTTRVKFDIAWENSWRTSTNESNYDGSWVFVKFRKKNTSLWQHATLNYVAPGTAIACGHSQPSGSILQTASDSKGCWMYRATDGQGNVNWINAELQWNYGVDGVLATDSVEVKVFAVEMVNIPEGNFYLGSGGTETYHFRDGAMDTYYPVNSEASIVMGTASGNLWAQSGAYVFGATIPANFPKGYKSFWCMKYETTEQQFIDFINSLSLGQANTRGYSGFSGTHPALIAPFPERAYEINGGNLLSMLDWSALRPMTELEYEKACRGKNILPIANEFAWGNTTLNGIATPVHLGTNAEGFGTGNTNVYGLLGRPMRVGALATDSSTRVSSGATYYGIMEMSGNTFEATISVANADGLAFNGTHGDGNVNSVTGAYNNSNWPNPSSLAGLGMRGCSHGYGSFGQVADLATISGRTYAQYGVSVTGGRGVRTSE